jgi:hypothetical protein
MNQRNRRGLFGEIPEVKNLVLCPFNMRLPTIVHDISPVISVSVKKVIKALNENGPSG